MMVSLLAGIVSLSNGIGRFSFGKAFDKLGINTCVIIESALFLSATLLLYIALRSGSIVILLISFILIGFAFGAPPTISAAYTHGRFGETNYSFNLSLMMFSGVIGALMGPIIVGKIYDVFGSYYPIIIVLCALSLAQLVIGLVWVKTDDARNTLG
jgi:MFS family permease